MRLICKKGPEEGKTWDLEKRVIRIGRDEECNISLRDRKISRFHGEVIHYKGKFVYFDRKSTNGTFINGKSVDKHILKVGDAIAIGRTLLEVLVSKEDTDVFWQESKTQISSSLPMEAVAKGLNDTQLIMQSQVAFQEDVDSFVRIKRNDYNSLKKGIHNVNLIYRFSDKITSVLSLDEIYTIVKNSIFEAFDDSEHVCIVLKSEDEQDDFVPACNVARNDDHQTSFIISRSIFNKTVEEKVAILASDAIRDERFSSSDSISDYQLRSVMCAPLISKGNILGAIFVDNRHKPDCFNNEDLEIFALFANQISQVIDNAQLFDQLQKAYHESILSLINAMEARDPYTRGHTKRTSRYALGIAREMGIDEDKTARLRTAAELHDIGKIGIKEDLMGKAQELSSIDYINLQQHVLAGEKILKPLKALQYVIPIVRGHHERFDGTGYPDGLKGDQILIESRILAVADAFDAMTTQRPYNRPLSFKKALAKIKEGAGSQFDSQVTQALERYIASQYILTQEAERLLNGDGPADTTH